MELNINENDHLDRLVLRMKRGERKATEEIYEKLVGKVFGFCMNRVRQRDIAEDLTQDIFLKLIDNVGTFDKKRGNFYVWFWRLARNTVVDHYRRRKESSFIDVGDENVERVVYEEKFSLDVKFELERLGNFIGELSEEEKSFFELRYVSELSYGEIAEILEKSEGALRVMGVRLRKKIKEKFHKI